MTSEANGRGRKPLPAGLRRRRPGPALKVTFVRNGKKIEPIRSVQIANTSYGFDYRCRGKPRLSFYYEVRNDEGKLLFRGFGADPTGFTRELYFSIEDQRAEIQRAVNEEESYFHIIVPKLRGATVLKVYSEQLSAAGSSHVPVLELPIDRFSATSKASQ